MTQEVNAKELNVLLYSMALKKHITFAL